MTDIIHIIQTKYYYLVVIILMMIGLYTTISSRNLIKKIIGLNIFQVSVFLFYITMAKVKHGTAPILWDKSHVYDNPLPHVLILTAIVVSVSTTAVALALIINIYKKYGTIEEDYILAKQKLDEEDSLLAKQKLDIERSNIA
jgi:multicomponent Na+:H+ antiporter subunit C